MRAKLSYQSNTYKFSYWNSPLIIKCEQGRTETITLRFSAEGARSSLVCELSRLEAGRIAKVLMSASVAKRTDVELEVEP